MRVRISHICFALIVLAAVTGSSAFGQDPGIPDTLRADTIVVRSGGSHGVPIWFSNDEPMQAFEITFDYVDTRLAIDSFSFSGGRVSYVNTRGVYTNGTNVSIYAVVLSEQLIGSGSGLLGQLYFNVPPDFDTFFVALDTSSYLDNGALHTTFFSDEQSIAYTPQVFAGAIDVRIGSCCIGTRGDINGDGSVEPDPVDLATLVDFLFSTPPDIPCAEEADINGDGSPEPDPVDLSYLVDFLFGTPPPLVPCPN